MWQKKAAVAVVPRQIGHHCHFILDLVTQVALQGSGIGSMGRAEFGWWGSRYQKFSVHGLPWELGGKIRESGSMGAWELSWEREGE